MHKVQWCKLRGQCRQKEESGEKSTGKLSDLMSIGYKLGSDKIIL